MNKALKELYEVPRITRGLVPCEPHEVTIALWNDPIPKTFISTVREETDDEFRARIMAHMAPRPEDKTND